MKIKSAFINREEIVNAVNETSRNLIVGWISFESIGRHNSPNYPPWIIESISFGGVWSGPWWNTPTIRSSRSNYEFFFNIGFVVRKVENRAVKGRLASCVVLGQQKVSSVVVCGTSVRVIKLSRILCTGLVTSYDMSSLPLRTVLAAVYGHREDRLK